MLRTNNLQTGTFSYRKHKSLVRALKFIYSWEIPVTLKKKELQAATDRAKGPVSIPGNENSVPPRTLTLQFLPGTAISPQTQIDLRENKGKSAFAGDMWHKRDSEIGAGTCT